MRTQKDFAQHGWYVKTCDLATGIRHRDGKEAAIHFLREALTLAPTWITAETAAKLMKHLKWVDAR